MLLTRRDSSTANERVAFVTGFARTEWRVIDHVAFGVQSARPRAGILTFLLDASLIVRTFLIHDTFGTAIRRAPVIIRGARTHGMPLFDFANRVWTARGRFARITGYFRRFLGYGSK